MIIDAENLSAGTLLKTRLCIVGAGPAGIALADSLKASGMDMILVESGGMPYDREENIAKAMKDHICGTQGLARGKNVGEPYFMLRFSRARGIGGSSNAFKGHGLRCRPLDAVDLEQRLGPEWPIGYGEIANYLSDAAGYCGVGQDGPGDPWEAQPAGEIGSGLETVPFRYGPKDCFARFAEILRGQETMRCITRATALELQVGEGDESGCARRLRVKSFDGAPFSIEADAFVICAGGIDNPRLLLNSPGVLERMGGAARQVGRYFMEHPHYTAGHLVPASPDARDRLSALFKKRGGAHPMLSFNTEIIRQKQWPRVVFDPTPVFPASLSEGVRAVGSVRRSFPFGPYNLKVQLQQMGKVCRHLPDVIGHVGSRLLKRGEMSAFALPAMAEQTPLWESRVYLSGKKDKLGMPLPVLDWRIADKDFQMTAEMLALMDERLKATGLGRIVSALDAERGRPVIVPGGWHHMGTTRMSADADSGVVDPDSRVHGFRNLYVAGSSVFPSGGYANPTLTLVALSLRVGQHLKRSGFTGA